MKTRVVLALLVAVGAIRPCTVAMWLPPMWAKNAHSSDALFRFVENNRIGLIDASGHIIIPARYDYVPWHQDDFSEGLLRVESNGEVRYIDDKGESHLAPNYDMQFSSFSEGLLAYYVREPAPDTRAANGCCRHLYGYLDRTGAPVIEAQHGAVEPFSEGLASVREEASNFSLGRAGYVDKRGKWVILPSFAMAGPFRDGRAVVVRDGQCWFGLPPWKVVAPAVRRRGSCGDNPDIAEACPYGVIDSSGAFVVRPQHDFIRDYSEGLAAFRDGKRWGFLDREGRVAIKPQFEEARGFSDNVAAVRVGEKWGYVSHSGEWVISPAYSTVGDFSEDRAPVFAEPGWGFIDKSGAVVIPFQFLEATPFAKGLAHVRTARDNYAWIKADGTVVFRYIDTRRTL